MSRGKSDRYATLCFEFCERIASMDDPAEVGVATIEAVKQFGFDFATCAVVPAPGTTPLNGILLNNRPKEYLQRYAEKDYSQKDPVVTELANTLRPYSWCDVSKRRKLSRDERNIMGEATEFGSNNGLIIPIVTQTGTISIFAPCGLNPELSDGARAAIEIIGMAAHQALRRAKLRSKSYRKKLLTPREREVLHWVAVGKTDDEIGEILHVARWTVVQHVDNAKKKLNASRRTLAVVEALRRGEIAI